MHPDTLPTDTFTITPRGMAPWARDVPAGKVAAEARYARSRISNATILVFRDRDDRVFTAEGFDVVRDETGNVCGAAESGDGSRFGIAPGPGRPALAADEVRTVTIKFVVRTDEEADLNRQAGGKGKRSEFIRAALGYGA
jgi:hypothetical protein